MNRVMAAVIAVVLTLPVNGLIYAPQAHASGWRKICAYENKVVVCKEVRR